MAHKARQGAEDRRLAEDARREQNWKRWGPYLPERQWGTVREDYSADGTCWEYFPHEHARSRAYRWGEDGLLGIPTANAGCALPWPFGTAGTRFLKERLFGLTNPQGNHGEDVKECYFYLDATPTSFLPEGALQVSAGRISLSSGCSKRTAAADDTIPSLNCSIREYSTTTVTSTFSSSTPKPRPTTCSSGSPLANRGPEAATLHLLPTLWFRNTWTWGCGHEGCWPKPRLYQADKERYRCEHVTLGRFQFRRGTWT